MAGGATRARSGGSGSEHVIDEPVALVLPDGSVTKHTLRHEHVMGRLEYPLEMGRVPLGEWQLLGELVQRHTPGEPAVRPSDLDQSIVLVLPPLAFVMFKRT